MSLPLRECGLKSLKQKMLAQIIMSLPLRECGLKSRCYGNLEYGIKVTPLAGVWIEIKHDGQARKSHESHSPCGSVD